MNAEIQGSGKWCLASCNSGTFDFNPAWKTVDLFVILALLKQSGSGMTEVHFYDPFFVPEEGLTYSVIAARHAGKWVLVRPRDRETWEIPGGHIERYETPGEAASRELMEETGARQFSIQCVATYSVTKDGRVGYGRLYFADIQEVGPVPEVSEIAETREEESLPGNLTYPDIQPVLLGRVIEYLQGG